MKKKVIMIISMISFFIILLSTIPMINAEPSIIVYEYSLAPNEFMPGDSGTLTLTIKNAETTNTAVSTSSSGSTVYTQTRGAEFNNIWIDPAYDNQGNSIKATSNYENTGYLAPAASFDITFNIVADESISEGIYFPNLNIDIDLYTDVIYPIPINVSNASVDLIATSLPSKISASGSTQISFTAVNNRDSIVDNVIVTPQPIEGIEFMPKSVFVGTIDSKSSGEVSFSIKPLFEGVKNLKFNLSYKNGKNLHNSYLEEEIEVISTLDVGSVFTNIPRSIKKGSSSRITLEVYNAKTEEITGVMVTPLSKTTLLPTQYFIGAMDPDDVFSASFDIFTDDLEYGTYTIDFEVSFKQGNEYFKTPKITATFEVGTNTGSNLQSSQSTSDQLNTPSFGNILGICIPIIVLIIIIIAIIIIWRWKKRRTDL